MQIRFLILIAIILIGYSCKNRNHKDSTIKIENEVIDTLNIDSTEIAPPPPQADLNETSIIDSGKYTDIGYVYCFVEEHAVFGNGFDDIAKFILETIKYPQSAIDDSIEGRVIVQFIVTANGEVTKIKVLRGVRSDLDEECIRAFSTMPQWKPAKQNGKKVNQYWVLPVKFSLDNESKGNVIRPYKSLATDIDLKVYPNPARDYITIETNPFYNDLEYQLYNSNGQLFKTGKVYSNRDKVILDNLMNGFYILKVISRENNIIKTEKIIIKN